MDTARVLEEKRERVLEQMRAVRSMRRGSVTRRGWLRPAGRSDSLRFRCPDGEPRLEVEAALDDSRPSGLQTFFVSMSGLYIRGPETTTFVGAIETAEQLGKRIYAEAVRRGLANAEKVVVLGVRAR